MQAMHVLLAAVTTLTQGRVPTAPPTPLPPPAPEHSPAAPLPPPPPSPLRVLP